MNKVSNIFCKIFLIIDILLIISALCFVCVLKFSTNTIKFETFGGSEIVFHEGINSLEEIEVPVKEGYSFSGWYFSSECQGEEVKEIPKSSNGIVTLYAKWIPIDYNIEFDLNCDETLSVLTAPYGSDISLPVPSREAYIFNGWFLDDETFANEFTDTKMPLNGAKLYAKWTQLSYNILEITVGNVLYSQPLNIKIDTNSSGSEVIFEYKIQGADDNTYSSFAPTSVGLYTLRATSAATATYKSASVTADFEIGKAQLTVSYEGENTVYGTTPKLNFSMSGFVNGENASVLNTVPVLVNSNVNAGTYVLIPSGGADDNYAFFYVAGDLTINEKPITVTAEAKNKIYGEADPVLTWQAEGLIGEDTLTGSLTRASGENAGNYTINQGTLSAGNNYSITFTCANLKIAAATLTVTYEGESVKYGTMPALNLAYSGFVNGENASVLDEVPFINNTNTEVGVYNLLPEGGYDNNYSYYYVEGVLEITVLITVYLNNQDGSGGTSSVNPSFGSAMPAATAPTKIGYNFNGYFTETNGNGIKYYDASMTSVHDWDKTADCTLYAYWSLVNTGLYFYQIEGDISYSVSKGTCTDTEIILPEIYNGLYVTTLPNDSFRDLTTLTSITIPFCVTKVGTNALTGCTSLAQLTAPFKATYSDTNHSYLAYYFGATEFGCYNAVPSSLKTVNVNSNISHLANNAFYACTYITTVNLPSQILTIGVSAFYGCTKLENFNMPSSLTEIKNFAFYNCYKLSSITVPSGIIGANAFRNCISLVNVNLSSGVTSIMNNAFTQCSLLEQIVLPSGIISIGDEAFYNCNKLSSISIPASATNIGKQILENCTNLITLTAPFKSTYDNANNSYLAYYFGATSYGEYDKVVSSLKTVYVAQESTQLADYAFYGCLHLTEVVLPSSLTSMGNRSFYGCALNSITIPASVTNIGSEAFSSNNYFEEIHLSSATPPTLGINAFETCHINLIIYVPIESLSAYQTAENWSLYSEKMIGE